MDLTGFNAAEKAGLSADLSEMLSINPAIYQFLNKITYSLGVEGLNYIYSPGLEGITFGKYLGKGDKIKIRDTKMRPKTVKLEPWNSSYGVPQQDILEMKKGGDINNLLVSNMGRAIPMGFWAMMIEYLANDPGAFGVLPVGYDCTAADEQAAFSASGYLDNIQTLSGWDYGSIKNDINALIAKMLSAKHPQSDLRFFSGQNLIDMEMVIVYPQLTAAGAQTIQAFRQAFEAENGLHTIGGTIYNASGTNLEYKFNVTLIADDMWREVFGDKWGVFLIPKGMNAKYAALISLFENTGMVGDYSNAANGLNFNLSAGENGERNVGIFSIATLGPGSTYYEENRKWAHSINGFAGITCNRFMLGSVQ